MPKGLCPAGLPTFYNPVHGPPRRVLVCRLRRQTWWFAAHIVCRLKGQTGKSAPHINMGCHREEFRRLDGETTWRSI
jgi:hypothetical protein